MLFVIILLCLLLYLDIACELKANARLTHNCFEKRKSHFWINSKQRYLRSVREKYGFVLSESTFMQYATSNQWFYCDTWVILLDVLGNRGYIYSFVRQSTNVTISPNTEG